MSTKTITTLQDLGDAYAGSYYTIAGAGGDLNEWVEGYEGLLREEGIGTPVQWFTATGASVNDYAYPGGWLSSNPDAFQPDLTFLFFPLDGLNVGKLAIFKLRMQDRWFDDIIQNMRD